MCTGLRGKNMSQIQELLETIQPELINTARLFGFSEADFGKWVFDGNIDTAQNVRWLPDVLKDEAARKEFLKTDISHAITKLNTASSKDNIDLKSVPYGDLCNALILKLRNMPYEEIKRLRKGEEEIAQHNKNLLIDLREELEELISDIEGE